MYTVEHYCTAAGRDVIAEWLDRVADKRAEARIVARVNRLRVGNFGDCKPCREGVWEIRIAWGAGYRVYYARVGCAVILLLCGGDKETQDADIDEAIGYLKEFKRRPPLSERKACATVPHEQWLRERLRVDGEFAREYLQAAIDDDDPRVLLFALRDLAEAQGMAQVAEAAGIPRESLYRALGPRGNPRFSTLTDIMKAIGMRLTVTAA